MLKHGLGKQLVQADGSWGPPGRSRWQSQLNNGVLSTDCRARWVAAVFLLF